MDVERRSASSIGIVGDTDSASRLSGLLRHDESDNPRRLRHAISKMAAVAAVPAAIAIAPSQANARIPLLDGIYTYDNGTYVDMQNSAVEALPVMKHEGQADTGGNGTAAAPYLNPDGYQGKGFYVFPEYGMETAVPVQNEQELLRYRIALHHERSGTPYHLYESNAHGEHRHEVKLELVHVEKVDTSSMDYGKGTADAPYQMSKGWQGEGVYVDPTGLETSKPIKNEQDFHSDYAALSAKVSGTTPSEPVAPTATATQPSQGTEPSSQPPAIGGGSGSNGSGSATQPAVQAPAPTPEPAQNPAPAGTASQIPPTATTGNAPQPPSQTPDPASGPAQNLSTTGTAGQATSTQQPAHASITPLQPPAQTNQTTAQADQQTSAPELPFSSAQVSAMEQIAQYLGLSSSFNLALSEWNSLTSDQQAQVLKTAANLSAALSPWLGNDMSNWNSLTADQQAELKRLAEWGLISTDTTTFPIEDQYVESCSIALPVEYGGDLGIASVEGQLYKNVYTGDVTVGETDISMTMNMSDIKDSVVSGGIDLSTGLDYSIPCVLKFSVSATAVDLTRSMTLSGKDGQEVSLTIGGISGSINYSSSSDPNAKQSFAFGDVNGLNVVLTQNQAHLKAFESQAGVNVNGNSILNQSGDLANQTISSNENGQPQSQTGVDSTTQPDNVLPSSQWTGNGVYGSNTNPVAFGNWYVSAGINFKDAGYYQTADGKQEMYFQSIDDAKTWLVNNGYSITSPLPVGLQAQALGQSQSNPFTANQDGTLTWNGKGWYYLANVQANKGNKAGAYYVDNQAFITTYNNDVVSQIQQQQQAQQPPQQQYANTADNPYHVSDGQWYGPGYYEFVSDGKIVLVNSVAELARAALEYEGSPIPFQYASGVAPSDNVPPLVSVSGQQSQAQTGTSQQVNPVTLPNGTTTSSNSISAPPNTDVGQTVSDAATGATAPTYSKGSSYQGPGEYISSTGAPEYIGSQDQFNQQQSLGFVGQQAQAQPQQQQQSSTGSQDAQSTQSAPPQQQASASANQQSSSDDLSSSTQTVQYQGQAPVEVTTTTTPTSTGNEVSITASPAPSSQPSSPFGDGSGPTQVAAGNVPTGATEVSSPSQATVVYVNPINGTTYYYSTGK
ncbi:MAG: hypothetical protein KGH72_06000 [Candidatus Micrarchaeota archaeon]|nr:hypothetical protein [Candidatus Micrarchaeota archaeon]